jgi:hypothetical protein
VLKIEHSDDRINHLTARWRSLEEFGEAKQQPWFSVSLAQIEPLSELPNGAKFADLHARQEAAPIRSIWLCSDLLARGAQLEGVLRRSCPHSRPQLACPARLLGAPQAGHGLPSEQAPRKRFQTTSDEHIPEIWPPEEETAQSGILPAFNFSYSGYLQGEMGFRN